MAARIVEPGYKVDMVPVLVGKQGTRKTTLLESVAPSLKHYGDVRLTERPMELALKVMGKIVVAWEELRGVGGRRDADEVKTFITNRYLDLRSKSKIGTDQHLRRFIIVGTSNRRDFLRDPTGHRRYLPFDVGLFDLDRVKADKDQLWAEARHVVLLRKANGQPLVEYQKAENLADAEHQKYLDQGRWVDDERLVAWLKAGNDRFRTEDAMNAVDLHMPIHRPDLLEMAKSLRQLGFDYRQTRVPGLTGKPKRWRQPKMSST
jgi:predicted P-loop ATPase